MNGRRKRINPITHYGFCGVLDRLGVAAAFSGLDPPRVVSC